MLLKSIPEKRNNILELKKIVNKVVINLDSLNEIENDLSSLQDKLVKRSSTLEIIVQRRHKFLSDLEHGSNNLKVYKLCI